METGISASPNTIKDTKLYRNVISPGGKKTELTQNKWTESAATVFRNIPFSLWVTVSNKPKPLLFKRNKTVKNNPWKLMLRGILSTKQEKTMTVPW